ncbi:hypothetical protein [Kitasatospora sp. DSM 101779]|uniref:hypothetical protein n=1 Tax=Kitasatospora sp. DSM 101779 TaxID=2853165 RepID=UPI0021DAF9C6|nr:hypothetical protein [Kitasatospora sp. DSM 101779]MCU7826036.1 hypothetical protein [Kitasatospora sp. DSM 101779]
MILRSAKRLVLLLPVLWLTSLTYVACAVLLVHLRHTDPEVEREIAQGADRWPALAALAVATAVATAWARRPDRRRRFPWHRLAARALALFVTAVSVALLSYHRGGPDFDHLLGLGAVTTFAVVLCILGWGLLNLGPARAAAGAVAALAASALWLARAPERSTVAVLAAAALLVALGTTAAAVWRVPRVRLLAGLPPVEWTGGGVRPPERRPVPGEMWWADVPFEESGGSKDRPVLVVRVLEGRLEVLRSTSQDRLGRSDHIRLPTGAWNPEAAHDSCLDLRLRTLTADRLRRYAGPCPVGVWRVVRGRTLPLVKPPRTVRRAGAAGQAAPRQRRPVVEPVAEPASEPGGAPRGLRRPPRGGDSGKAGAGGTG